MVGFRFIADGDEYTPIYKTAHEGYEASDFEQTIKGSGVGDGGALQSTKILPRYLTLSFDILSDSEREEIIRFFAPRRKLTHIVTRGDTTRQIVVYVNDLSIAQEKLYSPQKVQLSLVAPDPYFYSMDDYGKDIARVTPQFAFPLAFTAGGIVAGYNASAQDITLTNDGHDTCGIRLRIVANSDCKNIVITKISTGEYIKFTGTVAKGDVIEISTVPKQKYARLNGVNAMNRIDRRSTFFSLDTGLNHIGYGTDSGRYNIAIYMYFKRRFLGV